MARRRTGARALKSWKSALRAALKLAGTASAASRLLGAGISPTRKPAAKKIVTEKTVARAAAGNSRSSAATNRAAPRGERVKRAVSAAVLPGAMAIGRFRNASGTRGYRLYRPLAAPSRGTRLPLIVMLHGCTQDAEHFAATTRMQAHANDQGCWVLYPEQSVKANRHQCWNWFEPAHQQRGGGEPAVIAGMVRKMIRVHGLDAGRVFVAGLSAGGALAVVLGRTYPELFSAVGVCAGMPYAAARTATTALLAMRGRHRPAHEADATGVAAQPVRTIVIHGSRDRIVVRRNADAIVAQALEPFGVTTADSESGVSNHRAFTRIRRRTAAGTIAVEQWTISGMGHAWSGGAIGAFSDPLAPDASAILLQFFLGAVEPPGGWRGAEARTADSG